MKFKALATFGALALTALPALASPDAHAPDAALDGLQSLADQGHKLLKQIADSDEPSPSNIQAAQSVQAILKDMQDAAEVVLPYVETQCAAAAGAAAAGAGSGTVDAPPASLRYTQAQHVLEQTRGGGSGRAIRAATRAVALLAMPSAPEELRVLRAAARRAAEDMRRVTHAVELIKGTRNPAPLSTSDILSALDKLIQWDTGKVELGANSVMASTYNRDVDNLVTTLKKLDGITERIQLRHLITPAGRQFDDSLEALVAWPWIPLGMRMSIEAAMITVLDDVPFELVRHVAELFKLSDMLPDSTNERNDVEDRIGSVVNDIKFSIHKYADAVKAIRNTLKDMMLA